MDSKVVPLMSFYSKVITMDNFFFTDFTVFY
jgi:hypothetical protein